MALSSLGLLRWYSLSLSLRGVLWCRHSERVAWSQTESRLVESSIARRSASRLSLASPGTSSIERIRELTGRRLCCPASVADSWPGGDRTRHPQVSPDPQGHLCSPGREEGGGGGNQDASRKPVLIVFFPPNTLFKFQIQKWYLIWWIIHVVKRWQSDQVYSVPVWVISGILQGKNTAARKIASYFRFPIFYYISKQAIQYKQLMYLSVVFCCCCHL